MTEPTDPLIELRESFRAAAAREIAREQTAASPVTQRRRRRRWLVGTGLAAVTATGGLAAATQLISTGSPREDREQKSPRYVRGGDGVIALSAPDPEQRLPWGVVVYRSPSAEQCALVGQLRGNELGLVDDGAFHAFERRTAGACGPVGRVPLFFDLRYLNGRSLVYGRARRDAASVQISHEGETRSIRPGVGGAFLFVFDAGLAGGSFRLAALDGEGKPLD